MKIDRIEEMRLTRQDEAAIARLLKAAFGTDFGGRSYYQNRHNVRLVVRDGDKVIGHMAISLRDIRMGDNLVTVAGLAEVATDPDHRGKGIASALMTAAIAEAKASLAEFFVLFGDQALYAGVGFETKPNRSLSVAMYGVRTGAQEHRQNEGLMVMQLRETPWDDTANIDLLGFAF